MSPFLQHKIKQQKIDELYEQSVLQRKIIQVAYNDLVGQLKAYALEHKQNKVYGSVVIEGVYIFVVVHAEFFGSRLASWSNINNQGMIYNENIP